jgi:two-component system, NtrC family, sensor histidine kinase HydH
MLAAMRRVPPLAIAIVLIAAALVATVLSTRSTVNDAFEAARDGQAFALQQAVRGDLADLGKRPTAEDLDAIVTERADEGLRYLAILDGPGKIELAAGAAELPGRVGRGPMQLQHAGARVRIEAKLQIRRAWGPGRGNVWLAMEIESPQAAKLRSAATRTLAIGLIAAIALVSAAAFLMRMELKRREQERVRERERRLASLGEMSAVLAHEIRNPLASLKGNAQLLASSIEGDKPKAKAQRVVDEAVRLEKLTHDLLAFVRTGELDRAPTAPAEIVRDVIDADLSAAPATWSLDPARMREVMVNLVDNAKQAGEPVEVRIAAQGRRLVIDVRDHGPGVPAAERDKIFEPFFTGKTQGTGLGLAITKRIVELHQGTITVDDAPDGGALFRIEIPDGPHSRS